MPCRRFIRRCKQGCLQFVILKPILVVVTLILYAKGKYEDGNFNPLQSYLYLTIIYTISYSMALYALALFYVACRDLLEPFNPVPKFIIIKSVVFLTYWQVGYWCLMSYVTKWFWKFLAFFCYIETFVTYSQPHAMDMNTLMFSWRVPTYLFLTCILCSLLMEFRYVNIYFCSLFFLFVDCVFFNFVEKIDDEYYLLICHMG